MPLDRVNSVRNGAPIGLTGNGLELRQTDPIPSGAPLVLNADIKAAAASSTASSQRLLSVRFDELDLDEACAKIASRDPSEPFAYVVTPNADHFIRLEQAEPALRNIYEAAWLSLCDSRVLRLLAGRRGISLPLAPGSDLTRKLLEEVIRPDEPLTIIGCSPETIEILRARFSLTRLTHHNPPMGFITDLAAVDVCLQAVLENPARFVLLCVGSPQQEVLAAHLAAAGGAVGVGLCVGASLDFVTGVRRRAPLWMQRAHLEWLHRLISEPRRLWRRYILEAPRLIALIRRVPRASKGAGPQRDGPDQRRGL
ncbi:MAG TPA: WecB/TagA/CpsF family glycosyltransferase [Roseomonas sp.]